jgi:hypothetical protein
MGYQKTHAFARSSADTFHCADVNNIETGDRQHRLRRAFRIHFFHMKTLSITGKVINSNHFGRVIPRL